VVALTFLTIVGEGCHYSIASWWRAGCPTAMWCGALVEAVRHHGTPQHLRSDDGGKSPTEGLRHPRSFCRAIEPQGERHRRKLQRTFPRECLNREPLENAQEA
jgi:hypothetical protein